MKVKEGHFIKGFKFEVMGEKGLKSCGMWDAIKKSLGRNWLHGKNSTQGGGRLVLIKRNLSNLLIYLPLFIIPKSDDQIREDCADAKERR